jgi:hypothetical protein
VIIGILSNQLQYIYTKYNIINETDI